MKARELLDLIGAKPGRGDGRKKRVRTTVVACKAFVAAHQVLLRHYVRNPHADVIISDLIGKADLAHLGFESWRDANNRTVIAHPAGDDYAITLLVGLVPESEIQEHQRRARREAHGLAQREVA